MAMRCVVVTPERTELDEESSSLVLPLFDGQIGILPGHAPLVGRLGYGLLRMRDQRGVERQMFIDGGFVQVEADVVSVLTSRAVSIEKLDVAAARQSLEEALAMPAPNVDSQQLKAAAVNRARGMVRAAETVGR